jgi:hypothetical protein
MDDAQTRRHSVAEQLRDAGLPVVEFGEFGQGDYDGDSSRANEPAESIEIGDLPGDPPDDVHEPCGGGGDGDDAPGLRCRDDKGNGDGGGVARGTFRVGDAASANWVVRKIRQARGYAEHVSAWAAAEALRARREEEFLWRRFGRELRDWTFGQVATLGGRRRSIALPAGVVGFRQGPPAVRVTDEAALLDWARRDAPAVLKLTVEVGGAEAAKLRSWLASECPSARIDEQVIRTALRERVEETGECPPGADVSSEVKFYVK